MFRFQESFSTFIACLGSALRYVQVCKEGRSSMLKIQRLNHFCEISCLAYARSDRYIGDFGVLYGIQVWCFYTVNTITKQPAHMRSRMQLTHPRHMACPQHKRSNFQWAEVYDRYISGIYLSYVTATCVARPCLANAGKQGLSGASCRFYPIHNADYSCFSNRETCNTRLRYTCIYMHTYIYTCIHVFPSEYIHIMVYTWVYMQYIYIYIHMLTWAGRKRTDNGVGAHVLARLSMQCWVIVD